jgi:hypothetical protein
VNIAVRIEPHRHQCRRRRRRPPQPADGLAVAGVPAKLAARVRTLSTGHAARPTRRTRWVADHRRHHATRCCAPTSAERLVLPARSPRRQRDVLSPRWVGVIGVPTATELVSFRVGHPGTGRRAQCAARSGTWCSLGGDPQPGIASPRRIMHVASRPRAGFKHPMIYLPAATAAVAGTGTHCRLSPAGGQ